MKEQKLLKINKQFARPASNWDDDCNIIMNKIYKNCDTFKI